MVGTFGTFGTFGTSRVYYAHAREGGHMSQCPKPHLTIINSINCNWDKQKMALSHVSQTSV
jgi:hypothetical protein